MNAAVRAKDAKARATIAAGFIRRDATNSLAFDDCFEMGDGTQVVIYLLAKAVTDPAIAAYAERAKWTLCSRDTLYRPNGHEVAVILTSRPW